MKEWKESIIIMLIVAAIVGIAISPTYFIYHPEMRNISYYGNDDYYMVNVITGSGRSESWHFGAITKEDYERWRNQEIGTIWITSSQNIDRGWRLNISSITTIQIFDEDWLPFNF